MSNDMEAARREAMVGVVKKTQVQAGFSAGFAAGWRASRAGAEQIVKDAARYRWLAQRTEGYLEKLVDSAMKAQKQNGDP